jgi:hypothetical protein
MKVTQYDVKAKGSQLVADYVFDNGYTAEQSAPSNPFGGAIFMVFNKQGNFATDTMKQKAKQAIDQYHA